MEESSSGCAVVFDFGSLITKFGLSFEEEPKTILSVVSRSPSSGIVTKIDEKPKVGIETVDHLRHPIDHGIVTSFDDLETLMHYCWYTELKVAPEDHPLVVADGIVGPKANREKLTQIAFEHFNVPAFHTTIQHEFSMFYHCGQGTGVVLDLGAGVTWAVPLYQGYALPHAFVRLDLAGNNLDVIMEHMVDEKCAIDRKTARQLKEKYGYVCGLNYAAEVHLAMESPDLDKTVTLDDGNVVTLSKERFECCEALFQPQRYGFGQQGIHENIYNACMKCDVEIRKDLFSNVIVTGGASKFRFLKDRLQSELSQLTNCAVNVEVIDSNSPWKGAAKFASSENFDSLCLSKEQYDESGPSAIFRTGNSLFA